MIIIHALLLLVLIPLAAAQPWTNCGRGQGNYSAGSTYETNLLDLLLGTLCHNASSSPTLFAKGSLGAAPDTAWALILCRGDVSAKMCYECVTWAGHYAATACNRSRDVALCCDQCYVRLADHNFFDPNGNAGVVSSLSALGITNGDVVGYDWALTGLFSSTVKYAVDNSSRMFAMGYSAETEPGIYSAAQCAADLSRPQCRNCLQGLMGMWRTTFLRNTRGARLAESSPGMLRKLVPEPPASWSLAVGHTSGSSSSTNLVKISTISCFRRRRKGWLPSTSYSDSKDSRSTCCSAKWSAWAASNSAMALSMSKPAGSRSSSAAFSGRSFSVSFSAVSGSFSWRTRRAVTKIMIIVLTSSVATLLFSCIYVLIWHRKGRRLWFLLCKKTSGNNENNYEAMIASYGSLAPKRYTYSEVMKITSSRSNELGKGGYGVVFKGTLLDGRLVAVKFLHECKGNGGEFVNEVMSIGRTSHVNVVSLFGFCLEGSKRALIYEYMSNNSLDKFIYSEDPKEILGWDKLYVIAIGIARGLEYLHHSCNTRIVHFDIKPQNILLDKDFSPKIADFGLAKLCHTKESKVSMTGARGTIGFIALEVHSRTFGVI
ncbi:G-type lectin S-receptor-like serine/threonine-protein kinase SD1-13, partial [Triticum aestivum]|uniref:G-type lectin S-receptor-like serine/threonine-protein kinase SD1-13 n=1 Tax=Triticum aestivum TaxID=4565 RepID=UPI001D00A1C8